MRANPTTSERVAMAIADAILILPLAAAKAWQHGKSRLEDAAPSQEPEPRLDGLRTVVPVVSAANVIDWVRAYETRHGRKPKIVEVQEAFGLSKTTAWRKIRAA